MKKIITLSLCILFFMSGCKSDDNGMEEKYQEYEDYKNQLINNNGMVSYDIPFRYACEVVKLNDGTYSYTIGIDEPQIAMYQIKFMAMNINNEKEMAANIGILDDETYSFIPNQEDIAKGFPKGIAINGVSSDADFTIYALFSYHSAKAENETIKVFFTVHVVNGEVVAEVSA